MKRLIAIIGLCLPLLLHAEHVFEAGLHGGLASYDAQVAYLENHVGWALGGQIYYTYFTPHVIGLRTGVTLEGRCNILGRDNYEDAYSTIDVEDQQMDIQYSITTLRERYTTWSVGIPLQLALSRSRFSLFAGPKLMLPLTTTWKQTADHAALSVYYPDYDNTVYESYPLAASRDFQMQQSGRLTLPKIQWWLSLEFNYALPLNTWAQRHRSYLMLGVYFDYCLTSYTPGASMRESLIMLSDTRDGFPLQRILTPAYEANREGRHMVQNLKPYTIGVKISYAISPRNPHRRAMKSCMCL